MKLYSLISFERFKGCIFAITLANVFNNCDNVYV